MKKERRVRGREARVSEERMEWRRGGVRWGMSGESEASEGLSEVSTEMTVWTICGGVNGGFGESGIGCGGGDGGGTISPLSLIISTTQLHCSETQNII